MDKGGDVRPRGGGARFSTAKPCVSSEPQPPGFGGIRGDLQVLEKSKKEKVRSLSAVSKELSTNYQMGCHLSHKTNASPSSAKRFKLPKKRRFLSGCTGVDPASVPRKIRSAMKKRGRESILLSDSEKVSHKINNGTESPEKDAIKKSKKQGTSEWSTRQDESGPITKDEEEVVASLFVLAGMFPNNGSDGRTELEYESLPDNSLALQDPEESANANFQDASPCPEKSPEEDARARLLNETSGEEKTDFPESAKFLVGSDSNAPKMNLQAMPTMVRSENSSEVALHDSELCLAMGLNMPRQSHITGRKPGLEFEKAEGIDYKEEPKIKDQKESVMLQNRMSFSEGPALWPGLSPRAPARVNASNLQSSAKAPDWMNAARCAFKRDIMDSSSGGKLSEVGFRKKSWKRCAAHVHISHLIRSLEASEGQATKEPELHESQQMRVPQGSSGVYTEIHNFNGLRNRISSAAGTFHSSAVRNSHATENGSLQQLCHYQDRSQGSPIPVLDGSQKQSFSFLSLSAGNNRLKVNDGVNIVGSRSEPMSKLQVPYFQSIQQQHGLMPIPMPQSQYASSSYLNRLPVAGPQVRLQQPPYYGSPLCGSHYSSTVPNKQQLQNFWAVQLASQGRSTVNSNTVRAQYPNWPSGRQDYSAAHVILPHSPASLEAPGPKITAISEQQLFALASFPPSRTKGLDIHLPSTYEEGRFRSSGTPSLQLLCDERI